MLYYTSLSRVTIPLQAHHHTVLNVPARGHNPSTSLSLYCIYVSARGSQSLYKYITILYFTSLPRVTNLLQVHHHIALYVSVRGRNPSTSTSPYSTISLSPGSQYLYKYITILYFTSLPGVIITLQVHRHTILNVSARIQKPSTSTSPYCTLRLYPGSQSFYKYITMLYLTSLPKVKIPLQLHHHTVLYYTSLSGVTIPLQVHHHTVLHVSVRGRNPSTSTSPYSTISLSPGSQYLYKYITILYFTSLPGVIITLQVHRHTILNVSARVHKPSTSTSPYCTLRLYPGSQSFYNYTTILYFMYLPGVTILLQVHHRVVLYVSSRGENPSTSTSPYCTWRLCPGSQSFYMFITILYFTSLPGVTILLQVHHHTVLYASVRDQNPSTSTSPYCILRLYPGSQSSYKYITILYFTYLRGVTIPLQLHHHTLRLCLESQSFYKYITILYFTSLPGVTIPLQVHHHIVLYVSAPGHKLSTSTSPYCTLRLCPGRNPSTSISPYSTIRLRPGSQSFYKYITILYFTSLPGVTILLQVHHHTVLYISALGHNPSTSTNHSFLKVSAQGHNPSTSTSPYCSFRLCPGSQSFYKYITILFYTSLPGVTILPQVHHHTVLNVSARGHNSSTSTSPYCTIPLCPGSQSFYKYITILFYTSLPGVTILPEVHHHTVPNISARGHNSSTSTSPYCTIPLCPGSQSFYKYITILYVSSRGHSPSKCISLYCIYVSARSHNPSTRTSPYCTLLLCPGS